MCFTLKFERSKKKTSTDPKSSPSKILKKYKARILRDYKISLVRLEFTPYLDEKLSMDDLEIKQKFLDDASHILKELEHLILDLETFPNLEILCPVFTRVHYIKVAAKLCGFKKLSLFCHDLESFIISIKKGERPISKSAVNCIICSREMIATALAAYKIDTEVPVLFNIDFNTSKVSASSFEYKKSS